MASTLTETADSWFQRLSRAPILRLLLISFVILLLQIPLFMVRDQIDERQAQKNYAVHEVTSRWGGTQALIGPILVIPYLEYTQHHDKQGKPYRESHKRYAGFLPEQFNVDAQLHHETRQRGLFEVPLYQSDIRFYGQFIAPSFANWGVHDEDIQWQDSQLVVLVSDAHAIQERAQLIWNKQTFPFLPGSGDAMAELNGYHLKLGTHAKTGAAFSVQLHLNGSGSLQFAPVGSDTAIHMKSDWSDPSFTGSWLPVKREVTAQGFNSEWHIAAISRGYEQQWQFTKESQIQKIQQSLVGTDFLVGMDNYRMSERSSKYELMFLFLTFLVIWLMEIMTRQRVHVIQYILLGSALCLFYLLLTALSEHIGFQLAYVVASLAIVLTASLYGKTILGNVKRGMMIGGLIAALYSYLYSLLNEQNYAFLIGSIGLFIALVATMYLTRHVDWFNMSKARA